MDTYIRTMAFLSRVAGVAAAFLIGGAVLVICDMVIERYILNLTTIWQIDVVTYAIVGNAPQTVAWWLTGCIAGGLVVGVLGLLTDTVVFRRLRGVDQHYTLIATFALLLVVSGLVKLVFGLDFRSVRPPPGLDSSLSVGSLFIPYYSLFVIAAGIVVFVVLELAMHRSWGGKLVQAGDIREAAPYGWPIKKGSSLAQAMQKALQQLIDNGVYDQVCKKWGVQSGEIKQAEINGGTS